ncbi:hypothetical protein EXIGLDRAFT_692859 [Exidia glandulosa HHB12029]|uniref:Uncharacterized protein n=1 Tax=Exidia glandulosa HHB12029 TaxID=1314781 RepID=A0A165NXT7_EXIGL|nr:hypothetical protein EXIGLDRAFT_692859 [Exidia glandulosa HHB12029]
MQVMGATRSPEKESQSLRDYERAVFIQQQAHIFADCVPWIGTLAIFTRHWLQQDYWRTWTVQALPGGAVSLTEEIGRLGPHASPPAAPHKGPFRKLVNQILHHGNRSSMIVCRSTLSLQ